MQFRRSYWFLWVGQLVSRIGMISPAFLVLFFQNSMKLTSGQQSLLVGLFAVGVMVAGAVGGALADAFGPKRIILVAQACAVVTAVGYFLAPPFWMVAVLTVFTGVFAAVDRPAGASVISNLVGRDQFAKAYTLYLVGFNIGMTLSPVLAGLLLQFFPPAIFVVWAVSSACYWLLIRVLPVQSVSGPRVTVARVARSIISPYRRPQVAVFLGFCFVVAMIYLQVNSSLPLAMKAEGLDTVEIGLLLAVNAVLSIILLPFVTRVVGKWKDGRALALASALIGVGFGINVFGHSVMTFGVAVVVWTLGEVIWAPMSASFLADRAPEGHMSSYQASFFFVWNAAFVIGGPVGVMVGEAYGYVVVWWAALVLGAIGTLGFLMLPRINDRQPVVARRAG